jgi:hypothetical protein
MVSDCQSKKYKEVKNIKGFQQHFLATYEQQSQDKFEIRSKNKCVC